VLEEVTASRQSSIAADDVSRRASAENALQGALGRLLAVAEAYPELKADKNFLALQQQLAEIEDQLQMARRYYNGTVRNLNISIESFPSNLVAGVLGFRELLFFELEDRAQAASPTVAFQAPKP
jgi:LemA protein